MKIISWLPAPLKKTFPYNYFVNTLEPTVNKKVGDVFHPEKIMNGTLEMIGDFEKGWVAARGMLP